jgi:hypothetical protein
MSRVIHFEIHAENPERAIKFYQTVFSWQFSKMKEQDYWIAVTGKPEKRGIDGALIKRKGESPVQGQAVNSYVCTIEVDSLEGTLNYVELNGGKTVVPKMPVPTVGWLAYCNDTEGNIFGIMQNDPEAK